MLNPRKDFPILSRQIRHSTGSSQTLIYLDNAATTQKPNAVIEAEAEYYRHYNANVHRGIHTLAEEATKAYEETRFKIMRFIGARSEREIIFTKGTTEGINLIAQTWGRKFLQPGDQIIIPYLNHHSHIVPWQMLAEEKQLELRWLKVSPDGQLNYDQYRYYLQSGKVKLVALTHVSNTLGTIYPMKQMIAEAHQAGALALVDAAQSIAYRLVDVKDMEPDFLVFSGHKMYGPTGTGILYGTESILESMPPYHGGGEMIRAVTKDGFVANYLPWRYEAGTPNIAGVIGLGAAVDYLERYSQDWLLEHSHQITAHALRRLAQIPDVRLVGATSADHRVGIIAFNLNGVHPHDVAAELDQRGIAVRAGHHCTQPLHTRLGLMGSVRISFGLYTTTEEIDQVVPALEQTLNNYKDENLVTMPHEGTVSPYATHLPERPIVASDPNEPKNITSQF